MTITHQNTIDGNNTNDCIQPEATVTEDLVPDHERLSITADLFGFFFPMKLEPAIYQFAETLSDDYRGGYWTFYHLSNGGFYMAPDQNEQFEVQSLKTMKVVSAPKHWALPSVYTPIRICPSATADLPKAVNITTGRWIVHVNILRPVCENSFCLYDRCNSTMIGDG